MIRLKNTHVVWTLLQALVTAETKETFVRVAMFFNEKAGR
jgi:hypothetical protein